MPADIIQYSEIMSDWVLCLERAVRSAVTSGDRLKAGQRKDASLCHGPAKPYVEAVQFTLL
jgi:hypothetical protein